MGRLLVLLTVVVITASVSGCASKPSAPVVIERDHELFELIPGIDESGPKPYINNHSDKLRKLVIVKENNIHIDWIEDSFWNERGLRGKATNVIRNNIELYNSESATVSILKTVLSTNKEAGNSYCSIQLQSLLRVVSHDNKGVVYLDRILPVSFNMIITTKRCEVSSDQLLDSLGKSLRLVAIQGCGFESRFDLAGHNFSACLY